MQNKIEVLDGVFTVFISNRKVVHILNHHENCEPFLQLNMIVFYAEYVTKEGFLKKGYTVHVDIPPTLTNKIKTIESLFIQETMFKTDGSKVYE